MSFSMLNVKQEICECQILFSLFWIEHEFVLSAVEALSTWPTDWWRRKHQRNNLKDVIAAKYSQAKNL